MGLVDDSEKLATKLHSPIKFLYKGPEATLLVV
jgi:hypothetical protein